MNETIIIKHADIWTMDSPSRADWMVLQEGKILTLGTGDGYKAYCSGQFQVIDAMNHTVLPGFIDGHFHVAATAVAADWISLDGVKNYVDYICEHDGGRGAVREFIDKKLKKA